MVSGNNVSRPATHRELKKLIITRVAALFDVNINLDPLGRPGKNGEKLPHFIFGNVDAELVSGQNFL